MGFSKIFIGLIFLFDFRINGFDILPDIIAYIFIYQGLKILSERNINFEKAKNLALPLIFLSILDIYQNTIPVDQLGRSSYGGLTIFIGIIMIIVNLMMIYRICIGIKEEAYKVNDSELALKSLKRWNLYLGVNITFLIAMLLPFLLPLLFIPMFIASIVSYVLMLNLMKLSQTRIGEVHKI